MHKVSTFINPQRSFLYFLVILSCFSCEPPIVVEKTEPRTAKDAIFLILDEESIDNGNLPNNFSASDVNDPLAKVGERSQLSFFQKNIGKTIELYTGQVGDEGWHAVKTIPNSWISAGPTNKGLLNLLAPGPGLGGGKENKEILLDKIPGITPLRATGLSMLKGNTILALVYDGNISVNYDPLTGNLQGSTLGIVAFEVIDVVERRDASSSSLPKVKLKISDANAVAALPLLLFSNAPILSSSSVPLDVIPPADPPLIQPKFSN